MPRSQLFDVVIDDGMHSIGASLNTLYFGLRHVRPGGFVVVEDIPWNNAHAFHAVDRILRTASPPLETQFVLPNRAFVTRVPYQR